MTNQSLVLQAVEAARPQFATIVAENQSGLDTDLELEYVAYILDSFGESITSNMDANSVYWSILNQATIGLSVEEGLNHGTFLYRHDYVSNFFVLEFMPTYHGLIHLAFESGEMAQVSADQVFSHDQFIYHGSRSLPEHTSQGAYASGDLLCAYAVGETLAGHVYCEALSREELDEIELMAAMSFSSNQSVWNTAFVGQMRKKSAIRRMMRLLFNQLGFDKPYYRSRIKTLMSVEDNMWTNMKSSMDHEIARAKKEKELLGTSKDSVPVNTFGQPIKNTNTVCTSKVVSHTGMSAADLIKRAGSTDGPTLDFVPTAQDETEQPQTENPSTSTLGSDGFMGGWGY